MKCMFPGFGWWSPSKQLVSHCYDQLQSSIVEVLNAPQKNIENLGSGYHVWVHIASLSGFGRWYPDEFHISRL